MVNCNGKHLAYGVLEGGIPFAGKFTDGERTEEISGDLQWQTFVPDSNPEEGKLNVAMVIFVDDNVDVGNRPRDYMRLGCDMVSQLNSGNAKTEETVLGMLLESSGNSERFDIQRVA